MYMISYLDNMVKYSHYEYVLWRYTNISNEIYVPY